MSQNLRRRFPPAKNDTASTPIQPNSLSCLSERVHSGSLGWRGPLVMCGIRLPLLLLAFLAALWVLGATGHSQPAQTAEGLTRFDLPILVDAVSIGMLIWLTQREGMRLRDLLCLSRAQLIRDLLIGILLFISAYILLSVFIAGMVLAALHFASGQQNAILNSVQGYAAINPLGLPWQIVISALILPVSTGFTEELVYRGYVLPRLAALSGSWWLAIGISALGFGAQHLAYGLLSWPLAVVTVISELLAGLVFGVLYRITHQRLLPLMLIHWQVDLISLGLVPLLLALVLK